MMGPRRRLSSRLDRSAEARCSRLPQFRRFGSKQPTWLSDCSRNCIAHRFVGETHIAQNYLRSQEIDPCFTKTNVVATRPGFAEKDSTQEFSSPSFPENSQLAPVIESFEPAHSELERGYFEGSSYPAESRNLKAPLATSWYVKPPSQKCQLAREPFTPDATTRK